MSLYNQLFDWQKTLVDKIKDKDSYGLFLDMGLGKTVISLALAEQNRCEKVIVITINPKATESVFIPGSWFAWANQSEMEWELRSKTSSSFTERPELLLVNYEALFKRKPDKKQKVVLQDKILNFLSTCKGKQVALIIDESHKVKNLQSQQTSAIFKIQKYLKMNANSLKTYLLTGTPFTTGYVDLYTQLVMLGCDMTKGEFIDKFCVRGNIYGLLGWQQPIVSYKNVDELFNLIHQFAITIKSEEVSNLPEQIIVKHYTEESEEFKMFTREKVYPKEIKHLADELSLAIETQNVSRKVNNPFYRNIAYPSMDWLADTVGSFWLRCRELSIGFQGNAEYAKWFDRRRLDQLKKFLEQNEDNYVLFYNYTPELLEIYEICEKLGYNIDVYCGEIKSEIYYEKFSSLSEAEKLTHKKNIILANFQSGSTGKNWQAYNKCIIFSIPLFKDWQQGIKRVHREGQKSTVVYHVFSQNNWLDESMQKSLDSSIDYDAKMFEHEINKLRELFD